jgi:hypothetical protein
MGAAEQQARGHRPARTLPERDVDFDKKPNPGSPAPKDATIGAALAGPNAFSVGAFFGKLDLRRISTPGGTPEHDRQPGGLRAGHVTPDQPDGLG